MPPKASSSQLLPQGSAKSKAKKAAARRKTVTKKAEGDDPPAAAGAPGGPEPDDSADTQSNLDKDSQIGRGNISISGYYFWYRVVVEPLASSLSWRNANHDWSGDGAY